MKKSTVGFFLLVIIGALAVVSYYFIKPRLFERTIRKTSDATGTAKTIRIGGDNYLGYWFITAPEMRKLASRRGIQINFTDDGGAYAERLEKFDREEYDCIVLPVNSYLLHGYKHKFPGVIIASISESKGADGIIGFSDLLPTNKINDLNDPNLRIVYTSESPSSFLLDLTIVDFDLYELQSNNNWRVEASSSQEVFKKAKNKEGDVFVLWEPDISRALKLSGMSYIWGSDKFAGYIIDVFVFHRNFLTRNPQIVRNFLDAYFRVMAIYGNNKERMIEEMSKSADLNIDDVRVMLEKIEWFDLQENCKLQFGITSQVGAPAQDGLINTIIACTDVMIRTKRLDSDPLQGNPYLITNSTVLEELAKTSVITPTASTAGKSIEFAPLDKSGWSQLREVGTLRVEPITFRSWNNLLDEEGKKTVDKIAQMLIHNYPGYRIAIRGHTAPGGDEAENEKLSLERAQAVAQYLTAVHGINQSRLKAEGLGSKLPPKKKPDESPRSYRYRLSRVELTAYEANPL